MSDQEFPFQGLHCFLRASKQHSGTGDEVSDKRLYKSCNDLPLRGEVIHQVNELGKQRMSCSVGSPNRAHFGVPTGAAGEVCNQPGFQVPRNPPWHHLRDHFHHVLCPKKFSGEYSFEYKQACFPGLRRNCHCDPCCRGFRNGRDGSTSGGSAGVLLRRCPNR